MRSNINQTEAVTHIMQYPFAQVREKLLLTGKLPEARIDEAINEFRKYLVLIALGHKNVGMNSREVDEVWHTFILFTRDYMLFCNEVFGHYLHHQPSIPSQPIDGTARQRFLEAYRREFGDLPSIWGINADCSPDSGGGGSECSPTPSCDGAPDPTFDSFLHMQKKRTYDTHLDACAGLARDGIYLNHEKR